MSTIKVFISNYDVLHSGQGGVKNVHTVHFLLSTSHATLLVPIEVYSTCINQRIPSEGQGYVQ